MRARQREILCLCHDATILQVRQLVLERFGYKVLPANSLEDAKNIAEEVCPDMLLMDQSYPGIDTEHVATQMKRVCPDMLTVVLSPFFAVRDASHSAVDRFVAGDAQPGALIEQIQQLFDHKGANRPASNPI